MEEANHLFSPERLVVRRELLWLRLASVGEGEMRRGHQRGWIRKRILIRDLKGGKKGVTFNKKRQLKWIETIMLVGH
jgi:hypothetical protein